VRSRPFLIAGPGVLVVVVIAAVILFSGGSRDSSAGAAAKSKPAFDPLPTRSHAKAVEPVAGETAATAVLPTESAAGLKAARKVTAVEGASAPLPRGKAGQLRASSPTGDDAITTAEVLENGIALPPIESPSAVHQIIEAGNSIARTPYLWGGGHGKWLDKGYDCSGSISYALASAGLLNAPLDSGRLMSWGKPGPGKWVTIYTNPTHVYMVVAGVRFDTSGTRVTGSRWQRSMRPGGGFVARHPQGL
jgi:cell wall-associated NlpC family hydrolase